ncbi:heterodimeric methylmalonyl-CoA mutase small subunit [Gelidibacter sediminis]|uniref:Heterodimeric methylmalonyl-CoA mutase small subunit n=1 Tax=Gelidibacter sediminis TaxID=1608710 RepID=A0A4R7PX91_9FLAO|nr:methylmalonyl-CoA mutase subunit beta [Gelidibacter sediminis]TDU39548.1 heterodimeric methylmalonyl-CoA mutase small subunit [Gelidibacter sediminis]
MSKTLFDEFSEATSKQWKQLIQYDLKGADYNETLIWKTDEGIHVKPFYHADEFEKRPEVSNTKATEWQICQAIYVANVEKSNFKAVNAIARGAESITFILPSEAIVIKDLLVNINLTKVTVFFECQFLSEDFVKQFDYIPSKENIHIHTDIIGNLAKTGNWFNNLSSDQSQFIDIVKYTNSFSINLNLYQNAGANMVQQLAYALAHANEYLNHLDAVLTPEAKESFKVIFNVSVGTNYFFEIAKLRALRKLWSFLAETYGWNTECLIFVKPTRRNKTLYDYNTNMLRTTTECMSAIFGGANTICNAPYDAIYHKDNEFSERIARNQLLVLKHESYLDKVNNPADGAYYIESLTDQLAEKSLALFKDIEANGGFLHQLKEGIIQNKIKESAVKEQEQFDKGELILLGTNKHPNVSDKMAHELELYPFVKKNPVKTLIEPIIEKRLAEAVEQKRLDDE